jgi:hypothetical protein
MRNVKLFEDFNNSYGGGKKDYSYGNVICISSDGGWSAAGMLYPGEETHIQALESDPGISIKTFPVDEDGQFVVLDGEAMDEDTVWKVVKEGDVYTSNHGYVFPVMQGKFFVALSAGHTVDFDIVKPQDLINL